MTIVFRGSTFFIVVVISLKMTVLMTNELHIPGENRLVTSVDRLIDESLRHRKEASESVDEACDLVCSIRAMAYRAICRLSHDWRQSSIGETLMNALHLARSSVSANACCAAVYAQVGRVHAQKSLPWLIGKSTAAVY